MYAMREELPNPNISQEDMIQDLFRMQSFLLPNVLGCFMMGLLIAWAKNNTLFGGRTLYRDIHVGLATGFCGSLTTFSSWMAGFNNEIFRRYWFLDFLVLIVEICLVWSFLCFGQHCYVVFQEMRTELLHHWRNQRKCATKRYHQGSNSDIELSQHSSREEICGGTSAPDIGIISSSAEAIGGPEQVDFSLSHDLVDTSSIAIATDTVDPRSINTETPCGPVSTTMAERSTTETRLYRLVGALVVISLVILWIICLIDVRHKIIPSIYMRDALRSVAFSPFGVSLRYLLKKWEVHIRNASQWGWFPWSTFLCNLGGSCIAAGIVGYSSNWGWGTSFITGFLGSWTTVSSLMKELEELHYSHGKRGPIYSTIYSVASFGIAIMFIQFIRLHRY